MATALRSSSYLKSTVVRLRGTSQFTTSTTPKMKPFTPTVELLPQHKGIMAIRAKKGEVVLPMCLAMGMILLSTGLGAYTAMKELTTAPNVYVKKSRRETIPELVEPEHVLEQSEKFIKNSFFRRVAHIQDKNRQQIGIDHPINH